MAKIKFKMSFEKFSFEYEGDQERAEKIQGGINQFFGSLAETQNQIIDVEAKPIESQRLISDSSSNGSSTSTKKRNRKGKKSGNGANAAQGETSTDSSVESTRNSRSSKAPLRPLLIRLIQEGFFSEPRQVNAVREELSKKGHNYESRGISSSLLALTREEYLARDNSSGPWEYWKGTKDASTES